MKCPKFGQISSKSVTYTQMRFKVYMIFFLPLYYAFIYFLYLFIYFCISGSGESYSA